MSHQDDKSPQTTRDGELSRPDTNASTNEDLTPSERGRLKEAQEQWKAALEKLLSLSQPDDEQVYTKAEDDLTAKCDDLEEVRLSIQERITSGMSVRHGNIQR